MTNQDLLAEVEHEIKHGNTNRSPDHRRELLWIVEYGTDDDLLRVRPRLVKRLRQGEQEARATKDRLYDIAGKTEGSVHADAVTGLPDHVLKSLLNALKELIRLQKDASNAR